MDSYVQFLMDHRVTAQMMLPTMHFMEGLKCPICTSENREFYVYRVQHRALIQVCATFELAPHV